MSGFERTIVGFLFMSLLIIVFVKDKENNLKTEVIIQMTSDNIKLTRDLDLSEKSSKWKSERLGVYIKIGLEQSKLIKKPSKKLRALEISLTEEL